jgi:hypothetical protein
MPRALSYVVRCFGHWQFHCCSRCFSQADKETHYSHDTVYLRKAGAFAGEITVCVVINGLLRVLVT